MAKSGTVKRGDCVIATVDNGALKFDTYPFVYDENEIRKELIKKAQANPGTTFASVKVTAILTAQSLQWS